MLHPFRAWRFDEAVAGPIADLVSQPYDKISPAALSDYRARSPHNIVYAIRGESAPGDSAWHEAAAAIVEGWKNDGEWARDEVPSYYIYEQAFSDPDGGRHVRRGITGAFDLTDREDVLHHERTHAGPREDRRRLIDATGLHFGQIFVLRTGGTAIDLSAFKGDGQSVSVEDDEGTRHTYTPISDPKSVSQLAAALSDSKYVIADGHHRFTVAASHADDHGGASVMVTAVDIDDSGLLVLPTHRVLRDLPASRSNGLGPLFQQAGAKEMPRTDDPSAFLKAVREGGIGTVGVVSGGGFFILDTGDRVEGAPAVQSLDAERIQSSIISPLLQGLDAEDHLSYRRSGEAAVRDVFEDGADVAFILNGIPPRTVSEVAEQGDVMPQKSTDFYPKLLTGFAVLDALSPS